MAVPGNAIYFAPMKTVLLAAFGALLLSTPGDQPPAPAATYKSSAELTAALTAGQATPDMLTSPVSLDERHRINLIRRTKPAGAVAHEGFAELHHIVEGSGSFVTGGTIVRPTGGRGAATIQDGVSKHVGKGDVVLVPPGVPHWYKDLDAPITYLEVRWAER
jgi:mannose-6-phosphate isomerase-like protein (cupin superfamily)